MEFIASAPARIPSCPDRARPVPTRSQALHSRRSCIVVGGDCGGDFEMGSDRKVAIVTGSNTGIGRETALLLTRDGMKVFLACRSADKAHVAATYIREACPGADVEILLLDLGKLESVRKCVSDFKSRNLPLNLLVNNAAVSGGPDWYTAEGVGGSAQVNYLGPYVLTRLLEDRLVAGAPSRVVNVSSIMHRGAKLSDSVMAQFYLSDSRKEKFLRDYKSGSYSETKLANVLFSFELQRRWQGRGVQTCAVDPGAVYSDIWRNDFLNVPPISWFMKALFAPTWDGATPVYHAATTPLNNTKEKTPLRLFARGFFAWSVLFITMHDYVMVHYFVTNNHKVTKPVPTPVFGLSAAALDWPVRYLSRGLSMSKVTEVPANPIAYDEQLASNLWTVSANIAGLPSE